jgi:hypothetical protein
VKTFFFSEGKIQGDVRAMGGSSTLMHKVNPKAPFSLLFHTFSHKIANMHARLWF